MKKLLIFLLSAAVLFSPVLARTVRAQGVSVSPANPRPGEEITITASDLEPDYGYIFWIRNTADDSLPYAEGHLSDASGSVQFKTSLAEAGNYKVQVVDRVTMAIVAERPFGVSGSPTELECGDPCPANSACSDTASALCPCSCPCAWTGAEWACGGVPTPTPTPAPIPGCIDTALGCIPVDAKGLAQWFSVFGIGLAGAFTVILLMIGGFKTMMSGGDKFALQEGKDQITAAITGLLLVIFSVTILRIVGFSVLGF